KESIQEKAKKLSRQEICLRLAEIVESHLRSEVLKPWFPRCVDNDHGGFISYFKEDWSRGNNNDKFLVFQSRMTWVTSQVVKFYPDLAPEYLVYARHGLDFLDSVMWDKKNGGFFWLLDETGKVKGSYGTEKHVYGIAFAIYALSAACEAT